MLRKAILKGLAALSVLSLAAFTTACEHDGDLTRPEIGRLTPPAETQIPRGSVPCTHSPSGWCLSDEENGALLLEFKKGELERDRKLCWLLAYFGYPPCEP